MKSVRFNNMIQRKGQITIFIILGIIILFAIALLLYFNDSQNKVRPPVQQLVVDDELKPLQVYVTDCLTAVSKDALIRLGQNGGYIDMPSGLHVDPARIYNSDALLFTPQVMPYWYYMKPCDTSSLGCLYIRNPPVCAKNTDCVLPYKDSNSMEEQLNNFIKAHMAQCLNNFEPFNDQFDISVDSSKMAVDSKIAESTVGFKLDYPLTIKFKGSTREAVIPYFYTEHKLKLKEIYQFAQEIRDAEANYTFLERNTLNLITVYSGIDSTKLPPMSGLEMFTSAKKYWIRSEVQDKLENDILPFTMLIQIVNSGNAQDIAPTGTDPNYIGYEEGLYSSMKQKVSNNTYFDLDANIYYPQGSQSSDAGSNIYLKVGNGEVIKPENFDFGDNFVLKMLNFALNDYSFKYDLTYPVIVRISDPDAFNGEGFTFSYAMQANIRQNVPVTSNITKTAIVSAQGAPDIDLEDMSMRVNRTINIETYDAYTKNALDEVIITYACGESFDMGSTIMKDGKAVLSDNFPFCEFGGEIDYEKAGYMGGAVDYSNVDLTTDAAGKKTFRIELWPLQQKTVKVYKRTIADINKIRDVGVGGIVLYHSAYSPISVNETVFLNLNRVKDDPRESDVPLVGFTVIKNDAAQASKLPTLQDQTDYINKLFSDGVIDANTRDGMLSDADIAQSQTADYGAQESIIPNDTADYVMDFVPGTYSIDAFSMYNGLITIPKKTMNICAGVTVLGSCVGSTKNVDLPEQNFSNWVDGGVQMNFTLNANDVYANNTLVLFMIEIPLPTNWDELQNAPSIEEYQADKLALLQPTVEQN